MIRSAATSSKATGHAAQKAAIFADACDIRTSIISVLVYDEIQG